MGVEEVVLGEPHQQVGLPHPAVPYYQQLHQVVVALLSLHTIIYKPPPPNHQILLYTI
jgi:hypothetical protein